MNNFSENISNMNQGIIDKYGISFSNNIFNNVVTGKKTISKCAYCSNDRLSEFLDFYRSVTDIDEDVLPVIDDVLNGNISEGEANVETVSVYVYLDNSKLYLNSSVIDSSPLNPDLILPTIEFRDLIIGWKEFLLTPPLDGTEVSGSGLIV